MMDLIDTHAHLYLPEFDLDREEVLRRSFEEGVTKVLLPNIDSESIDKMMSLADRYSDICYPMMGLHPTSVKEDYHSELEIVKRWLGQKSFIAVGEIGIDLYWDKTFLIQQLDAFTQQIDLAIELDLPVVIHCRDAFNEVFNALDKYQSKNLKGVFHAFTGGIAEAEKAIEYGFFIGIGGVITFKNSGLNSVIRNLGVDKVVLETDSPYLTPSPHRGKRNESSYIKLIADHLATITGEAVEEIAKVTTTNATKLFNL